VLHDEQPHEDFGGRRMASMRQREAIAVRAIAAHLLVERIVVEQVVACHKHRVGLIGQVRHAGKHIFGRVAVDEHGGRSFARLRWCGSGAFYHPRVI
jgi:hypothetical protein